MRFTATNLYEIYSDEIRHCTEEERIPLQIHKGTSSKHFEKSKRKHAWNIGMKVKVKATLSWMHEKLEMYI